MSKKEQTTETIANQLFPEVESSNVKYAHRVAWFRYSFYMITSSLFILLFLFSVVFFWFRGMLFESEGLISILGLVVAPFIPGLYWLRYRRGGYLVNERSLYLKEGFFFQNVREIPLASIKSVEQIKEKRFSIPGLGHFKLQIGSDELFLVDVREPSSLKAAIGKR